MPWQGFKFTQSAFSSLNINFEICDSTWKLVVIAICDQHASKLELELPKQVQVELASTPSRLDGSCGRAGYIAARTANGCKILYQVYSICILRISAHTDFSRHWGISVKICKLPLPWLHTDFLHPLGAGSANGVPLVDLPRKRIIRYTWWWPTSCRR